ncbi:ankyrin-1-like [Stylophora pistillata]|nr:ankyrin-1-like [Stylophora pistillata]
MLYSASHGGHLEVVKFLLDNGAFISMESDVHLTALQVAAENGHVDVVKTLYESGGVADQTALQLAVINNRLDVVKYLLKIGVKDKCMRCDGSLYWLKTKHRYQSQVLLKKHSFQIKKHCESRYKSASGVLLIDDECIIRDNITNDIQFGELFNDKHLIFCDTALHAAVSLGHKAIIEELVSREKWALACRDYSGRTPVHEAVRRNNTGLVEFLLSKDEAKIHATCDRWQDIELQTETSSSLVLSYEESKEYYEDVCHCGYSPLHLAARYGYLDVTFTLLKKKAGLGVKDCSGTTPLHVAACHDHWNIIYILWKLGADITSRSFNGSTPIHSAAACGAVQAIDHLIYHGANINEIDDSGLTPLHYAIKNITSNQLDRQVLVNSTTNRGSLHLLTVDRRGHLASFYREGDYLKNTNLYRWLDVLLYLILYGADMNAADDLGRTALHIAAENGLADAVNVLVQRGAKLEMHDRLGRTPLQVAVEKARVLPEHSRVILHVENFQGLGGYLQDHDLVVHLLLSSGVSFSKCNNSGESLLHRAVLNNQPYIAQMLLLKGANMNCKDSLGRTPLVAFLHNGGDWLLADAIFFKGSMKIKCGKPFNTSLFHLLCYFSPKDEDYNFFQQISCDDRTCSKNSPLEKAIESHRLKYKVIDSCLDAEGFTPLHRASQGANIVAVRNLIRHGADVSLRSPEGHDALTLAILHGGSNLWPIMRTKTEQLKMNEASDVALELLRHKMKSDFQIVCDSSKSELTLYHLAASRGLVKFIKEIFRDGELHRLNVDCPNKDGITPLYLAKLYSSKVVETDLYNPWAEVVQFIEKLGGQTQYPQRDAELNLIYNRLYGWIQTGFKLNPRPDVRNFVIRLFSTYKNCTALSMRCTPKSEIIPVINEIGLPFLTVNISKELLSQLRLLNHQGWLENVVTLALKDFTICQKESKTFHHSFSEYSRHIINSIEFLRGRHHLGIKYHNLNLGLYHLMMMWYKEVFQHFACFKMIFYVYRPFFLDDRKSKQLIERYEDSIPLWYLQNICSQLQFGFTLCVDHHLRNADYPELIPLYFYNYPSFAQERMGWTVDDWYGNVRLWPLEFLAKLSFDLYRKYDYLKILNIGLEPKTRISLYTDKVRKIFLASRTRLKFPQVLRAL